MDFRDFLLFLASILIATSSYMILLINSIQQRKKEEKRNLRKAERKKKRKIRKFKRVYELIRNLIIDVQKRAMENIRSTSIIQTGSNLYLGGRILELSHDEIHLKLLDCRIEDYNLIYSENYKIDGYNAVIEDMEGVYLHGNQEKMNILLEDLENTYKNAKKNIS